MRWLLLLCLASPLAAQTRTCLWTKQATGMWRSTCTLPPDTVRRVDTVRITTVRVDTVWRHDTIFVRDSAPVPVPTPIPTPLPVPTPTPTPVPANPGYPHEPSGAAVRWDYDTDFANLPLGLFSHVSGTSNLSTTTDPTAPVNPQKVGRVRFGAGCCDGSGPAEFHLPLALPATWTQLYVSDWIKFDPTWKPHACCQKIFEFYWSSGGDKWLIFKTDPSNGFPLQPRINAFFGGEPLTLGGRPMMQPGVWYQVELLLQRAGRVQLWVRPQGQASEVLYDGPLANAGTIQPVDLFWWWGYGGLGAYPGPTSYIYHNHMRVSWR